MPFDRKNDSKGSRPLTDARKIFIGRGDELNFFAEHILKLEEPTHNIVSISGNGGVGKSTLLARFMDDARTGEFKDYCLTALVDERQATPASMMEKFADQLHIAGEFKKALVRYKEDLRKLQTERETVPQESVLHKAPDFAGALFEGVPLVGPLLREGAKATTSYLLDEYHTVRARKNTERLEDPIGALTRAFIEELNRLADTKVSSNWMKRERRVMLFFDTFEQLAEEATPWLLDHFLETHISSNVVLVIAGRMPLERSTIDGPKRWMRYRDNQVIYSISLNSFSKDETCQYLARRGITDSERIETLWQLSRGLPLYLSLLTSNPQGEVDPTADVVGNFLRWIPQHEEVKRRLALDGALLSRPFNQDDLAAFTYMSRLERPVLYHWLVRQPFVRSSLQDGRYSYHELAQELFSRYQYRLSPSGCQATRRILAEHYQQLLEKTQAAAGKKIYDSAEWLELTQALAQQLLLLPDEADHIKAIEQVLNAYEHSTEAGEIDRILRELSQEQAHNQANANAREAARQLLQYAEADRVSKEFMAAANYLLERVAAEPTFAPELLASLYHKRGVTYRLIGKYQRAIEDFDRAIELNPNDAPTYGSRGIAYSLLHKYQQAITDFDRALALDPQYAWAYASRGKTYRLCGEYQKAISDFNSALALDPNYAWAYGNRGRTYRLLHEYQKAIADFDHAIELNPQYARAYGRRGEIHRLLNEYQQAISDYNRAIELDPKYAWAYAGRGEVYRLLGEYQQAMTDFDTALTLDPRHHWACSHRGLVYLSLKEYQRAIEDFDRALTLNPKYVQTYGRRGMAYLGLKDIEQAIADFTRNWELDAKDMQAAWMIEWCRLCQERNDAERTGRLESIVAVDPQHYVAHLCRGVALWLNEAFELALAEVEQAIALQPESWDAYFWRSMAYVSLGWDSEAQAVLDKALALGLPPVLLAPLRWLEQAKPDFYQQYAVPLLSRYE